LVTLKPEKLQHKTILMLILFSGAGTMFKQAVFLRSREQKVRMLLCSESSRFLSNNVEPVVLGAPNGCGHPFGAPKTTGST
jgi:hypothetical protein